MIENKHPEYWEDYTNLQKVKHELIKGYLSGWFNILGSCYGRIVYIDTHAGKGKHATGHPGSPIVALQTLLKHKLLMQILRSCEVVFYFIEADEKNFTFLQREIAKFQKLPERIKVEPRLGNCFDLLNKILEEIRIEKKHPAPAFVFIDPYGFQIPGEILFQLIRHRGVELFVNLMWRELDMQIHQKNNEGVMKTFDSLFWGPEWRTRINAQDQMTRAFQAADLLKEKIQAKWCTPFFMLFGKKAIRYVLLHFTNHDKGRNLMKDTMWKASPLEGNFARKSDDISQGLLPLDLKPNLRSVENWVIRQLQRSPKSWEKLSEDFLAESWRDKHLNDTVRKFLKEGKIDAKGKQFRKYNPILFLKASRD